MGSGSAVGSESPSGLGVLGVVVESGCPEALVVLLLSSAVSRHTQHLQSLLVAGASCAWPQ
eukprot:1956076-Rhodomonas_salina.1